MATVLFESLVIMCIFAQSQFLVKYKLHLRGLNKDNYLSVITMIWPSCEYRLAYIIITNIYAFIGQILIRLCLTKHMLDIIIVIIALCN